MGAGVGVEGEGGEDEVVEGGERGWEWGLEGGGGDGKVD